MAKKRDKKPSPLAELREQLAAIKAEPTSSQVRLRADLAGDTAEELFGKLRKQLRRQAAQLRKLQQQSEKWRTRLNELLHDLSTGPVILPSPPGRTAATHEDLVPVYRRFETQDFLALARTLHEAARVSDVAAYLRFLVDEILIKGSRIVAEHLIRQAANPGTRGDEDVFLDRLRHHVAGNVCQRLARQVGYQVTPDVGKKLDALITEVMTFLEDLLTATPPGRLLVPHDDSPYDPTRHQAIAGRPTTGELKVTATLFPGYVVLDPAPHIVAKAQVYTDRVEAAPAE